MQPLNTIGGDPRGRSADVATDGNRLSNEQWARVKRLFHGALALPAAARQAFIREACGGDDALETALESLLASDDAATDFLETPAVARVGVPSHPTAPLLRGHRLGAYEIVALIGAGGMGEVYRASDARLGRHVALKILPASIMNDAVRRQWLTREAQAAAALDHPNICPIFDIGEQDGRVWIAMQFVEGETLTDRLRRAPLTSTLVLDLASQIASALSAAHTRGIIHRDVKPENVMISATNHVKVLDFGLATTTVDRVEDTPSSGQSGVYGCRLGTLPYMSPEQVRGEPLDVRTDVFSVSVVLFEMTTGHRPFDGGSDAEVTAGILSLTPPSITDLMPAAPPALARIIRKGLEKERDQRYQTMAALAADLAELRQHMEGPSLRMSHRASVSVLALALVAVITVAGWWLAPAGKREGRPTAPLRYTRLTDFPDTVHSPALSADGTMLAFLRGAERYSNWGNGNELYVKRLPDGRPVSLTSDGALKVAPTFSPDGSHIAYEAVPGGASFSIPVIGGAPTLFMRNASALQWIGQGMILFSEIGTPPNMGVVVSTDRRTSVREIYRPASAQGMAQYSQPSPDGRQVLIVEMDRAMRLPCRLVPFDGSSHGRQVGPPGAECTSAAWSPDGRWMYFAAALNGESHLWRQRVPDGAPEQITFGPTEERGLAVDRDGRSVITSVTAAQSTVWYHDQGGDRSLSIEGYAYRPQVSPDGRRVFYLIRRAATRALALGELWAADVMTGRSERVLPGVLMRSYQVSADGTRVVFDALDEVERSRVWLMPLDRRQPPRQLTPLEGAEEQRPFFGRSGRVYFMRERSRGLYSLYRMKQDGSGREKLSDAGVHYLVNMSPDEKWAVSWDSGPRVSLFPIDGGAPTLLCGCGLGPIYPNSPSVAWSGDGRSIYLSAARGRITLSIPWQGADTLRAVAGPSLAEWEKLPGARHISEVSVAPGPTSATYAFMRQSQQSNLFRVELP